MARLSDPITILKGIGPGKAASLHMLPGQLGFAVSGKVIYPCYVHKTIF